MTKKTLRYFGYLFILFLMLPALFNCQNPSSEPSRLITPMITKIEAKSITEITLEWAPVPGADYYNIYQGENSSFVPDYPLRENIRECKYTVNTLTDENRLYFFRVRAFSDGNKNSSAYSEANSARTKLRTPVLYPGEADKYTANSIALEWEPVQGANSYEIQYAPVGVNGQTAGNWNSKIINNKDTVANNGFLEYAIGGLQPDTRYFFKIKALAVRELMADNESEFSTPPIGITTRIGPPILLITSSVTEIRISWPPVTDVVFYGLNYNENDSYKTAKYIRVVNDTEYELKNLPSGTDYYFWVTAHSSKNYSLPGAAVKGSTLLITPVLFAGDESEYTASSVTVKWEPVDKASFYEIRCAVKGANGQPAGDWISGIILDKDTTQRDGLLEGTIGGLQANTNYFIKIKARNSSPNESAFSNQIEVITRMAAPMPSITNMTTEIRLSWQPVSGANYYRVYYNTVNSFTTAVSSVAIYTTQYDVKNLNSGTSYYFWITAHNNQNYSLPDSPVQGKTVTSSIIFDFRNPADPVILDMPEYLYQGKKESYTVTVNADGWDIGCKWYLNGNLKSTDISYTVDWQLTVGPYEIVVVVTKDGVPYSVRGRFTVK